ncbi:MAG: thiol-disulfide isomerase/thioredoxin [Salibacteraceae bacterium]|jgi:thiol-disulfide isomerase/thioredoxin
MNTSNLLSILTFCLLSNCISAQYTVTGDLSQLAGQEIRLIGFNGFEVYIIDSTTVSNQGVFKMSYGNDDRGMGYLTTIDNKASFVVLSNENIELKGESLNVPESIVILSGNENKLFVQYATEHPKREQTLNAWEYLKKIYQSDSLFNNQTHTLQTIEQEVQHIKDEDSDFLKNLNPKSYVSWFLPTRKLVSSVSVVAQYKTEKIPATLNDFRKLDYADERLYKSGLLKDAIESHFWLLENMGQPLDIVYNEMCVSIDSIITNLSKNDEKFNLISKYLFNLLERQSLLKASEYLAVKVLTQNSCTVNDELANQLESYRAMKIGNTAPNIVFNGDVLKNGADIETLSNLYDIEATYKIVLFGASWCQKCTEELGQLLPLYQKWKAKGVEVVFVSLDSEEPIFKGFSSIFPFISICDYKKWNSQAVKDYYIFASPTLFLLDKDQKILLRPNSVKQVDAWIDSISL